MQYSPTKRYGSHIVGGLMVSSSQHGSKIGAQRVSKGGVRVIYFDRVESIADTLVCIRFMIFGRVGWNIFLA